MKERPTIKDIAAIAGVSPSAVSYALNEKSAHKISKKTRQTILDIAKSLNYYPNSSAKSLREAHSRCISIALEKSITQSRFGQLLQGMRSVLQDEGYSLLLSDFGCRGQQYPEFLESVLQRRTDGAICISSDGKDIPSEWKEVIRANQLPFVACDCCVEDADFAVIMFDYERSTFEIGCRLLSEGSKKILYWRPNISAYLEQLREAGLRKAIALYPGTELIISELPYLYEHELDEEKKHAMLSNHCKQFLAQDILPHLTFFSANDAVVCSWDIMLKHLGVSLLSSQTSIKLASLSSAPSPVGVRVLTSNSGYLRGGKEAVRLLLKQIKGEPIEEMLVTFPPDAPQYFEG